LTVQVAIDETDFRLIEIFRRMPSRGLKAHEIRSILEYEGIPLGYGQIRYRLQHLSFVGIVEREKGSHFDRYYLHDMD
jgi:repressor of nif and glnA expression